MKTLLSLFAVLLSTAFNSAGAAETWVNNTPGAFITKIVIIPEGPFAIDPFNQFAGTVEITFANGSVRTTNLERANHSPLGGTPMVDDSYQYVAVYFCDETTVLNRCDAIALKLENGQLCVGGFQFIKNVTSVVVSLYDLGCFIRSGQLITPFIDRNFGVLEKLSKDEILDLVYGRKRQPTLPRGPVCLSCPPWPEFKKELDDRIAKNLKKKFEISVKQLK